MAKKVVNSTSNFTDATKTVIGSRAGYRCSFPKCSKTLIGPGEQSDGILILGECAHIFSAAINGPRTNGGLLPVELSRPENGIFLCRKHHKIIDRKSKSNRYTSDMLLRYKDKHEFNISAELGEHHFPINWINSFTVTASPIFNNKIHLNLGKLTFLYGTNVSGKSTICELINTIFTQKINDRWNRPGKVFDCEISFDNPVLAKVEVHIEQHDIRFKLANTTHTFMPYNLKLFFLNYDLKVQKDDIKTIASCLGLPRDFVKSILKNISVNKGIFAKAIKLKEIRTIPYRIDELFVNIGNDFFVSFRSLSTSEQVLVILDIVISLADGMSAYQSVLLMVDWAPLFHLDKYNIKKVFDLLKSNSIRFQSIIVSPNNYPDIDWDGWVVARFKNKLPFTLIDQNSII